MIFTTAVKRRNNRSHQQAVGQIIEIGGPDNWSNNQVAALYAQLAGRPVRITHVPLAVLRVMSPLLKPFHPGLSQVMALSILVDTSDMRFDPSATLRQYPVPLTRLEDWVCQRVGVAMPQMVAVAV